MCSCIPELRKSSVPVPSPRHEQSERRCDGGWVTPSTPTKPTMALTDPFQHKWKGQLQVLLPTYLVSTLCGSSCALAAFLHQCEGLSKCAVLDLMRFHHLPGSKSCLGLQRHSNHKASTTWTSFQSGFPSLLINPFCLSYLSRIRSLIKLHGRTFLPAQHGQEIPNIFHFFSPKSCPPGPSSASTIPKGSHSQEVMQKRG